MDLNNELKKLTVDGVKELGAWIQEAKNFTVEQAPQFAQEYVKWWTVSSLLNAFSCLVLLAVCLWLSTKGAGMIVKKAEGHAYSEWDFCGYAIRCLAAAGALTCFLLGVDQLKDAAKGYYAPRVVLVDGISDIVNGKQNQCGR